MGMVYWKQSWTIKANHKTRALLFPKDTKLAISSSRPDLKVAITLDEINQTQVVKDILDHAKLTDRHKQILKQQSVKEQDVITTKK